MIFAKTKFLETPSIPAGLLLSLHAVPCEQGCELKKKKQKINFGGGSSFILTTFLAHTCYKPFYR